MSSVHFAIFLSVSSTATEKETATCSCNCMSVVLKYKCDVIVMLCSVAFYLSGVESFYGQFPIKFSECTSSVCKHSYNVWIKLEVLPL